MENNKGEGLDFPERLKDEDKNDCITASRMPGVSTFPNRVG